MSRSLKQFVIDVARKPPLLFPLVAIGHIFWLLLTIKGDIHEPLSSIVWLDVLWLLGYTTFWLAACDLRRWGAHGYIFLTLLNLTIWMATKSGKIPQGYQSNMFLIDDLFSVFIMFYYKRFR